FLYAVLFYLRNQTGGRADRTCMSSIRTIWERSILRVLKHWFSYWRSQRSCHIRLLFSYPAENLETGRSSVTCSGFLESSLLLPLLQVRLHIWRMRVLPGT